MQTVITKYHGPTNTRSARMSASCNAGKISVPFDHGETLDSNHRAVAEALRAKIGWTHAKGYSSLIGGTMANGDYAWNFEHTPKFNENLVTRNPKKRGMTLAQAKLALQPHRMMIRSMPEYNEFQVKFAETKKWDDSDGTVYFTNDLEDAVNSGIAMRKHRDGAQQNPSPRKLSKAGELKRKHFQHLGSQDAKRAPFPRSVDTFESRQNYDWYVEGWDAQKARAVTPNPHNRASDYVATGYDKKTYTIGDRVEIHPGTDLWMRGARYGTVVGMSLTERDRVKVEMDKLKGRKVSGSQDLFKFIGAGEKKNPAPRVPSLGFAIFARDKGPKLHYNGKDFTNNGTPKRYKTSGEAIAVARKLVEKHPLLNKYRVTVEPTLIRPKA